MQQIRQAQVRGTIGDNATLSEDIDLLCEKTKTYDTPVKTADDLPLEGNDDGDVRLVISEDRFYYWHEDTQEWKPSTDLRTESRTMILAAQQDGQTDFNIGLKLGIVGGIASVETVKIIINGMTQSTDDIEIEQDVDNNCIIKWVSTEFELETTDHIALTYDILVAS